MRYRVVVRRELALVHRVEVDADSEAHARETALMAAGGGRWVEERDETSVASSKLVPQEEDDPLLAMGA